jgi:hypothetical protein
MVLLSNKAGRNTFEPFYQQQQFGNSAPMLRDMLRSPVKPVDCGWDLHLSIPNGR